MEGVLMEVVLSDGAGGLQGEPVFVAQGVYAHQADDLLQLALLLQHVHDLLHHGGPVRVHFLIEPGLQTVQIQGI